MDLEPLRIDRSKQEPVRPSTTRRVVAGAPGRSWTGPALLLAAVALAFLLRAPLLRLLDRVTLPRVRTVTVEESDPREVGAVQGMAANGYVVAARRAALSADTPGRIVELNVTEGSAVQRGQIVARLFSDELEAALQRADAELAAAKVAIQRAAAERDAAAADVARLEDAQRAAEAQVEIRQADLDLARTEIARVEELLNRQVATQRELDNARQSFRRGEAGLVDARARQQMASSELATGKARVQVTEAGLAQAAAQVQVAQAAREQVQATLSKTEVRAPFDGVVVLKDAEVGEVVSPNVGGGTNARGSVVTMVDFESLEVQVDVPETSLQAVRPGGAAQVFLDAWPSQPYPGRVDRVWPTANRQKATVEVRVSFLRRDQRLRPDMGARVVFLPPDAPAPENGAAEAGAADDGAADDGDAPAPTLLIPEEALCRRDGEEGVFVLEGDVARFRRVQAGERRSGRLAVLAGLSRGEPIVSPPPPTLQDGERVLPEEVP